jgi:hypothetical protein
VLHFKQKTLKFVKCVNLWDIYIPPTTLDVLLSSTPVQIMYLVFPPTFTLPSAITSRRHFLPSAFLQVGPKPYMWDPSTLSSSLPQIEIEQQSLPSTAPPRLPSSGSPPPPLHRADLGRRGPQVQEDLGHRGALWRAGSTRASSTRWWARLGAACRRRARRGGGRDRELNAGEHGAGELDAGRRGRALHSRISDERCAG